MSTLQQRSAAPGGDGLGYHVLGFDNKTGDRLELLRLRSQFSGHAPFDTALRQRFRQLAEFSDPAFARVRQIDGPAGSSPSIVIVSPHVAGVRLSEILTVADSFDVRIDVGAALCLARQLTAAIATLHAFGDDISHGCISPEHLLLTADGRLIVTEHILGSALEAMEWAREKFWYELRIVLPANGQPAVFDRQADIMQIGLLTLALLENRQVYGERRYPLPLARHIAAAREMPLEGPALPVSPALAEWLTRALQRDLVSAFTTIEEMLAALDRVIDGSRYDARQSAVAAFAARCREASPDLEPRAPERAPLSPRVSTRALVSPHDQADVEFEIEAEAEPITFMPVVDEEAVSFEPVTFERASNGNGNGNRNGAYGTHAAHATHVMPAPASVSPSVFEPEEALDEPRPEGVDDLAPDYELNSLLDMEVFVGMVHQQKRPFVVHVEKIPLLLVEPVRRAYWLLPRQAGAEPPSIGDVIARLRRGSLRYRDCRTDDPPQSAGYPIELLLWNLGMALQPDDLLPQVKARGWVQLTRWPDFGRIRSNQAQLKMSALLTTRAFAVDEVFDALGEPRPSVIAFLNACALCGLLADAPVEPPAPSVAHLAREGRSLGGLMQRLRGALGIGRA